MAQALAKAYCSFDGDARELSQALFGEDVVELLSGSPLACSVPAPGSIVDVSLPTFSGVNPSRIKARAYIQRLDRVLGDPDTTFFAVMGEMPAELPGRLDEAHAKELQALEAAFTQALIAQNDNAATIAHFLACHPAVAIVRYPGIKSDPSFADAAQVLSHGFGNAVDYLLEGAGEYARIYATDGDPFDQIDAIEARLGNILAGYDL